MNFIRYAVYFAPVKSHPLSGFGNTWLGWDAEAAKPTPAPKFEGLGTSFHEKLVATPKRYGFHATLKPPFRLAAGKGVSELLDAIDRIAVDTAPINVGWLTLKRLGSFLALVPLTPPQALSDLAGTLVRDLDSFRHPPTPDELAKRRSKKLNDVQEQMLTQWGYPYVLEEFRFHLTLTGGLKADDLGQAEEIIGAALQNTLSKPLVMSDIALFGDPGNGASFHLIKRFPLGGKAEAQT